MMKGAKGYLLLVLGIAAVSGAAWWLSLDAAAAAEAGGRPPYRLPVTLGEISRGDIQPTIALTGTVRTARWASLGFEIGGPITEISAQEGDVLAAGQPVARLNNRDQELGVLRSEADLAVAERQQELLLAGERGEVKRRLAAELEAARAQEEVALLEVDRLQSLIEGDYVTRQEADRAHADHRAAVARRQAAEERLAEAEAGSRAEDLAIAGARVSVARAALQVARRELEKTVLSAPWDGVVIRRGASAGDHVAAGEEIVVLADLAHLEVHVEVPAQHALRLGDDPEVILHLDEAPGFSLRTTLDVRIEAADQVSRNFRGIVRLEPDELLDDLLRPGMFVRLTLLLAPLHDALLVTSDAVRITEQGPIVVVAGPADDGSDGLVGRWVPVRIAGTADGLTALVPEPVSPSVPHAELAAGDAVVVTGVDLAYPGVVLMPRDQGAPGTERVAP